MRLDDARHLLLQQHVGRRLPLDLVQPGVVRPFERLERRHHLAHDIARNWLPEAYAAFTGNAVPARDSHVIQRRAAYEAAIGSYVSTAAYGDWADWVPASKVGVVFRKVTGVDALGFADYAPGQIHGLVDKERYADRDEVETFESLGAVRVESTAPISKQVDASALAHLLPSA